MEDRIYFLMQVSAALLPVGHEIGESSRRLWLHDYDITVPDWEGISKYDEEQDVYILEQEAIGLDLRAIGQSDGLFTSPWDWEVSNAGVNEAIEGWQELLSEIAMEKILARELGQERVNFIVVGIYVIEKYTGWDGYDEDYRFEFLGELDLKEGPPFELTKWT